MCRPLCAEKLASEGELIVTVDKKPFAVMIHLGEENVQDGVIS